MTTHQKTLTVEHPGDHSAPESALEEAAKEAGLPEGYTVVKSVNESGVSTKYTVEFEGEPGQPELSEGDDPVPAKKTAAKKP